MANLSNINNKFLVTTGGNVLINKTAANNATVGTQIMSTGDVNATVSGDTVARFNRLSSDGEIIRFQNDTATDGAINCLSGRIAIGSSNTGIFFDSIRQVITPWDITDNDNEFNNISFGRSIVRFKDIYLSGKVVAGTGSTDAATINAFSTTVSAGLHSALRIIENTTASSYWDIGATNGASTILNFYHNGTTTPKITFTHLGGATFADDVGIGTTTNISSPLTVQTDGSANSISIIGRNNGANDEAIISFYEYDGTTRNSYIIKEGGDLAIATGTGGSPSERMRIGSSGDVTIKTNGKFLQGVRNTGSAVIDMIGFGAGTDRLQIKGGTSGGAESIAFFDTAGQMATFYDSRFGIGNTTPKFALNTNLAMEGASLAYLDGTSNNQTTTNNIGVTHNASGFGGTNGAQGGLFLANNNNANNAPSPIIFFGARSASSTYNHAYAAIYGIKTGGGADSNWNVGELTFATGDGTGPRRRMTINKDGNVGIGTETPPAKLSVYAGGADGIQLLDLSDTNNSGRVFYARSGGGSWCIMNNATNYSIRSGGVPGSTSGTEKIRLTGYSATSWTSGSDETIKENIKPIGNVLNKINDYRCVEYNLIDDETKDKKIGFIAQDWQEDFPQIIEQMENEKIGMKYTETIPILLKAIQELKAEIELLKSK